jgi:hypothetical protein
MAISGGGGGGGGGVIGGGDAWRAWNGVDVSQFEGSPAFITPTWSAPSLSVVAAPTAPLGFVLRLTVTTVAGNGSLYWLLNDTPPWDGVNRSLRIDIETTVPNANVGAGACFLCDNTGLFHGHQFTHSIGNDLVARCDADVEAAAVVAGATSLGPAHWRDTVWAGKPAAAIPAYVHHTLATTVVSTTLSSYADSQSIVAPMPASWNGLAADRVGIAFFANANGTFSTDFQAVQFTPLQQAA